MRSLGPVGALVLYTIAGVPVSSAGSIANTNVDRTSIATPAHGIAQRSGLRYIEPDIDSFPNMTTDTGPLAPGNKDFSRFSNPALCRAAVSIAVELERRTLASQIGHMLQDTMMRSDSIPASAVRIARSCGDRFTVRDTPREDLPDLFHVGIVGGRDSIAHAVLMRQLALASSNAERGHVLRDAVDEYLKAEPVQVAAAETTIAWLDTMKPGLHMSRMIAHQSLLLFAARKFNEPYMRREAERIIALGREAPWGTLADTSRDRENGRQALVRAYWALAQLAYVEHPDSVMTVITRAKQDLRRFSGGIDCSEQAPRCPMLMLDFSSASLTVIRNALLHFNAQYYAGTTLPPLNAAFWIPKAPEEWPPGGDRPSLIIYGGSLLNNCSRIGEDILLLDVQDARSDACSFLYTILPKWTQRYGNRVSLTLVAEGYGNAARSVVLSPAAEADSLAWFFRNQLGLPATVGLVRDSVWRLPDIDGRRLQRDTSFYGNLLSPTPLGYPSSLLVILYGAHGQLLFVGDNEPVVLEELLDRAVGIRAVRP